MTIEFLCVHCQAHIRVPDRAGGRGGECPRCRKKIKVPKKSTLTASAPEAAPAPVPASGPATKSSAATKTTSSAIPAAAKATSIPKPNEHDELEIEFSSVDEATGEEVSPTASRLAAPSSVSGTVSPVEVPQTASKKPRTVKVRRRGDSNGLLMGVVAVILVTCLGGAGYWWSTQKSILKEQVKAYAQAPESLPKVSVRSTSLMVDEATREKVFKALERNQLPLLSSVMEIYISAKGDELDIAVNRGKQTQFVAVEIPTESPIREYFQKNFETLAKPQLDLLKTSGSEFVEAYGRQLSGKGTPGEIPRFRDSFALPQLVGPLGFHLVAKTGDGNSYRCVAEQGPLLWFLLPAGVKNFNVEGRPIGNQTFLPVQLQVTVTSDPLPDSKAEPVNPPPATQPAPGNMEMKDDEKGMKDPEEMPDKRDGHGDEARSSDEVRCGHEAGSQDFCGQMNFRWR